MAVELRDLKKQYIAPDGAAVPVIDVPAFRLSNGEQVGLIGGSGTGKTTLLHLIAGILAPTAEVSYSAFRAADSAEGPNAASSLAPEVVVTAAPPSLQSNRVVDYSRLSNDDPVDITRLSEAKRDVFRGRNIGYIFQTHHLLPGFTSLENVLLGMSFTGRHSDPEWARHLLNEVGLSERIHYRPAKLSVGQQQRVAVARALANRPRLVLADEPTGALDPKNAQQVLELIRKLTKEVNASLILVSHDPTISNQLGRVVVLAELNRAAG